MLLVRLSKRISAWLYPDETPSKRYYNKLYGRKEAGYGKYPYNEIHPPYVNTVFNSRYEADQILSSLVDAVIDYGYASVEDLNELKGIDSLYTDKNWGWYNLDEATIERAGSKYRLNLPRPSKINVKDVIEKG
jgi:hypothetical protein